MVDMSDLMKQAQQMQTRMQEAQKQLLELVVVGNAANMVYVEMNGRHDVLKVTINPTLHEEPEMLADLVAAAVNDAVRQVEKESKKKINELTASLNLPTGFMKDEKGDGTSAG